MESIADMKKYIATLVETNRALASDLDASRRVAASLGHQRDAFELEATRWRNQLEESPVAANPDRLRQQVRQLRDQLAEQQGRVSTLTTALVRAERERDAARRELGEFRDAMDQIRCSVQGSLEDAIHSADLGAERWD